MIFRLASRSPAISAALYSCRRHFVTAAGFSALLNLLFLAPMLYMLQVYDRVVPTQGSLTLFFLTLVVVFALVTLSLLDFVRSRLLVRASIRLDRQLAGAVLDTTLAARGRTDDTMRKQAMREFDTLRQALTGSAILALFDAPWSPIYVLICFLIHPAVGSLAMTGGTVVLLLAWRNEKLTAEPLRRADEAAARAYVSQEQVLAGAEVARALGMRRALVRRQLAERDMMMKLQTDASLDTSRYVTLSKFLRLSLQSLALGLGAWLAINNQISAGCGNWKPKKPIAKEAPRNFAMSNMRWPSCSPNITPRRISWNTLTSAHLPLARSSASASLRWAASSLRDSG